MAPFFREAQVRWFIAIVAVAQAPLRLSEAVSELAAPSSSTHPAKASTSASTTRAVSTFLALSTVRPPAVPVHEDGEPMVPTMTMTTTTFTVTTTTPEPPILSPANIPVGVLLPGLVVERYDHTAGRSYVIAIDRQVVHWKEYLPRVTLSWMGFLQIKSPGLYRFNTVAAGFTELRLDGRTFLRTYSTGGPANATNTTYSLYMEPGVHPLNLVYAEIIGRAGVVLSFEGPDTAGKMVPVPPEAFFHQRGPCMLNTLPLVQRPACNGGAGGPRWALANGDSCEAKCEKGYFANGFPNRTTLSAVCSAGVAASPGWTCEPMHCGAPAVENSSFSSSCAEGLLIRSGGICSPVCQLGYTPVLRPSNHSVVKCFNGTWSTQFECRPQAGCQMPNASIMHAAPQRCKGFGAFVPNGGECVSQCETGYTPTINLMCQGGTWTPSDTFVCMPPMPPPTVAPALVVRPLTTARPVSSGGGPGLPDVPIWVSAALAALVVGAGLCVFVRIACGQDEQEKAAYSDFSDSEDSHLMDKSALRSFGSPRSDDAASAPASPAASPPPRQQREVSILPIEPAAPAASTVTTLPPTGMPAASMAPPLGSLLDVQQGDSMPSGMGPQSRAAPDRGPFGGGGPLGSGVPGAAAAAGRLGSPGAPSEHSFSSFRPASVFSGSEGGLHPAHAKRQQDHLKALMPKGFGHGLTAQAYDPTAVDWPEAPTPGGASTRETSARQEAMQAAASAGLSWRGLQQQQQAAMQGSTQRPPMNSPERILASSWQPVPHSDAGAPQGGHAMSRMPGGMGSAQSPHLDQYSQQPSWTDVRPAQSPQAVAPRQAPWSDVRVS